MPTETNQFDSTTSTPDGGDEAVFGNVSNWFDPVDKFNEAIRELFANLATEAASAAFDFLGEYVIAITDLNKIPNLDTLIEWSQWAAGVLMMIFLLKRIMDALKGEALMEGEANWAEIIGSAAISTALIFATPYIIKNFLIEINNAIVQSITGLGIQVDMSSLEIIHLFAPSGLTQETGKIIFMTLMWAIAFLIFSIAGAVRYVDLAIVLIMGPLAATCYTNRSEVYANYWVEAISVIFTQCIHVLLAYLMLQWSATGTLLGICGSIAGAVVAIRGPHTLRQFLYSTGTGSGAVGMGRLAFYKLVMQNAGR
ncbi:conjugal transfer protein TrbL family protein [Ammoniphilus sp. 3BR4]|uniref:conjugal transfer protein TrbL family protein n=1 Tax=Ammoniphilus sp. 3BR4 TaxID=3158265 RepID=UPI003466A400